MRIQYLMALCFVAVWMATGVARADLNEPPEDDTGAKPQDKSCYVRGEDGEVRFYLDGPLRDGELPYLQGRLMAGPGGKLALRDEIPQSAIPPRILRAPPCPPGKHHLS
jgi:hypothetical protein